jgi:hypothetical protein
MKRLIPFVVIIGSCTYLAWRIFERVGYALDVTSFMVGITLAAVIGFAWFQVGEWWSTMTRPYRPQTVKTDTKETPIQIIIGALLATVKLFLFIVLAIVLIILIVRLS